MNLSRLKLLAVLQILLGGLLFLVAVATLMLGQSVTRSIKADQAIGAYIQSIADTKHLVVNTVASINTIASQAAATCADFASSANSLADGIEWWNKWLGKERFESLTDATRGFRDSSRTLRITQKEITVRAPELGALGTSFSASCDNTITTLSDLRDSHRPLIRLIWLLGISGCCVAVVVLLSGLCLYGIATATVDELHNNIDHKAEVDHVRV